MTKDEELQQKAQVMLAVVGNLAQTAQALVPMIDLYEKGRERMESIGPVIAPSFYLNEERRKTDEIVWLVLKAAGERDARPRSDARHPSGGLRHIHAIDAAALAIRIAALDEAIAIVEKEKQC